jgi:hypothetical protein
VARQTERDVLIRGSQLAGRAMVIVASGYKPGVNSADEPEIHGIVWFETGDPAIGFYRCMGLPLRTGDEICSRRTAADGRFKLIVGKIRSLDSGGSGDFHFKLNLLELFHPVPLVWDRKQGLDSGFGMDQLWRNGEEIVEEPTAWNLIVNRHEFISIITASFLGFPFVF